MNCFCLLLLVKLLYIEFYKNWMGSDKYGCQVFISANIIQWCKALQRLLPGLLGLPMTIGITVKGPTVGEKEDKFQMAGFSGSLISGVRYSNFASNFMEYPVFSLSHLMWLRGSLCDFIYKNGIPFPSWRLDVFWAIGYVAMLRSTGLCMGDEP